MNRKQKACSHRRWKTKIKRDKIRLYVQCRECKIIKNIKTGELMEEAIVNS